MKRELGWYFPDGEQHLPLWMKGAKQYRGGVLQYQFGKYEAALQFVKQRRLAVDVGGHIGQWSRNMAMDFARVQAFEPVPTYAECWRKNLEDYDNAALTEAALGAECGRVSLRCGTEGSHGDTFVAKGDEPDLVARDVPLLTIDSTSLEGVDFIKIDCEGFELNVIRGGEKLIRRDRPCVIVEQKPGMAKKFGFGETEAVALLRNWGAKLRVELAGDYILSWD